MAGFIDLGGFDGMWAKYPYAFSNRTLGNDTDCHMPSEHWNIMLRGPTDNDMPWIGFLLGQTPGSIWYWCTDQVGIVKTEFHIVLICNGLMCFPCMYSL